MNGDMFMHVENDSLYEILRDNPYTNNDPSVPIETVRIHALK